MEFFEAALPYWIEDSLVNGELDLTTAPTQAEKVAYADYLSYYSPDEAQDYDWDKMTFDSATGMVTFGSKSDEEKTYEVPITTIRALDKVQSMMSNPMPMLTDLADVYETVGQMGDNKEGYNATVDGRTEWVAPEQEGSIF
jgi:hypothetical protein